MLSRRMCSWKVLVLMFAVAVTLQADDKAQWERHKAETVKNPKLLRYYVFEEGYGEEVKNLAASETGKMAMSGGPRGSLYILRVSPYGQDRQSNYYLASGGDPAAEWTQGRWPWKSALTNGLLRGPRSRCVFRSGFNGEGLDSFSVEAWVRLHENNTDCLLFAIGDYHPYKDGMMLTRKGGKLEFHVGSPSGGKAVSAPVSEGVWHQVVCGLGDGKLRLHVDGALAAEAPFDGKYIVPGGRKAPAGGFGDISKPFMEIGAGIECLQLGGRRTVPDSGEGRFDLDELAIFSGLLSDSEVAARHLAFRPGPDAASQLEAFRALRARTERLSKLQVSIPKDTWGYFPNGKEIPVAVTVLKDCLDGDSCSVELSLADLDGRQVWSESKILTLDGSGSAVWETSFKPALNGVYFLDARFKDADGGVLKRLPEPYCLAVTHPLPPREEYSVDNPLMRWFFPEPWDYGMPFRSMDLWTKKAEPKAGTPPFATNYFTLRFVYDKNNVIDERKTREHVLEMAVKHRDDVHAWFIDGEPEGKMSVDDYMKLLEICSPILREKCPGTPIVAPSATPVGLPFIKEIMRRGAWKHFDVLSFHDYQAFPLEGHRVAKKAEKLKQISMEFAGREMPLWNTESCFLNLPRIGVRPMTWDEASRVGYSSAVSGKGIPALWTSVPTLPEDVAPARLQQQVLLGLAAGFRKYAQCHGPSGLGAVNSSGLPNLTGVGLAALASLLNSWAKAEELPLSSLDDACVIVTAKNGRRTAALFSDRQPTLHFICEPDHEYQGMDMLGNPLSWRAGQDGLLRLSLGEKPLYLFDVPSDFKEATILKLSGPALLPDNGVLEGAVTVDNPFKTALRGELSLPPMEGATLSLDSSKVELASGQSVKIPFKLTAERLKRKECRLDCQLKDGGRVVAVGSFAFDSMGAIIKVPEMKAPITLDGDDTEWKDVPEQLVQSESDVVLGKPNMALIWLPHWEGPSDLSFGVRCAWRSRDGVYLMIKVKDDRLLPAAPSDRGLAFQWDCLELFFDGRPYGQRGGPVGPGADQVIVIPNAADKAGPCDLWCVQKDKTLVDATFVGRKTADGYLLEGKLTPRPGSAVKLLPGDQFCMDFMLDDTDDPERKRKVIMALHGGADSSSNASGWGRYQLEPAK